MPKNQKHLPTNIIWVLVHKRRKTTVTIPEVHRVGSRLDPSLVHSHRRVNGSQPGLVLGVPLPVAIAQGEGRQEGVVQLRYAGDVVLRREKSSRLAIQWSIAKKIGTIELNEWFPLGMTARLGRWGTSMNRSLDVRWPPWLGAPGEKELGFLHPAYPTYTFKRFIQSGDGEN